MIILIRGIPGSGKSTIAKLLNDKLQNTALIEADLLRIEILHRNSNSMNILPNLIQDMISSLSEFGMDIILEGTLDKETYINVFEYIKQKGIPFYGFYLDIDENSATKRLNNERARNGRGEIEKRKLTEWYATSQPLGGNEKILDAKQEIETLVTSIISYIQQ